MRACVCVCARVNETRNILWLPNESVMPVVMFYLTSRMFNRQAAVVLGISILC